MAEPVPLAPPLTGVLYVHEIMPIDDFTGLIPVPTWTTEPIVKLDNNPFEEEHAANIVRERVLWVERCQLAVVDAHLMQHPRHVHHVGVLPMAPEPVPYLVIKFDNNGTTVVVCSMRLPFLEDEHRTAVEVKTRF